MLPLRIHAPFEHLVRLCLSLTLIGCLVGTLFSQTSFTSTSATTAWNDARWNNLTDAAPYTSTFTANNAVNFTLGSYTFAGMGATTNVGNVTVNPGVSVSFSSTGSTYATGGAVRTLDIGAGGLFDLLGNSVSTAAGTGFIKSGPGVFGTGVGTFTGGFTLNAGTVIARGLTGLGSGATNVLTLNGGTLASNASRDFINTRFGGGIFIGGNVQFGELATNVSIASSTANLSFANNVNLNAANRTLTIGNNGTTTFSGNISNGALTIDAKSGVTGSIALTGPNTFTGGTTVKQGVLSVPNALALGPAPTSPTPAHLVLDGGTLQVTGSGLLAFNENRGVTLGPSGGTVDIVTGRQIENQSIVEGTGSLTKIGGGEWLLPNANTYTGATTVAQGILNVTGSVASPTFTVNSGATLTTASTLKASIGTTTVNGTVNGTVSGNGSLEIGSLATLAGTGTISVATKVFGTHSPGNSPSLQTFANDLLYSSGSTFEWELNTNEDGDLFRGVDPGFDAINVTGIGSDLTFGTNVNTTLKLGSGVDFNNLFWAIDRQWEVFKVSGAITGLFNNTLITLDTLGALGPAPPSSAFSWSSTPSGSVFLNYTAVPEPASLGGALVLFSTWVVRRRRK